MTAPHKGFFSAMLHTVNHNLGLKTPTGRKAGHKAIYTSVTGLQVGAFDLAILFHSDMVLGKINCSGL